MERNNIEIELYREFLELIHKHKNVEIRAIVKNENSYKIIVKFDKTKDCSVLLDFVDHLVLNYTTDILTKLKIKNSHTLVAYVKKNN